MAITLADFNKIWASTSPLTPYSFSDNNYKQGWNFIGSTPPARQMWDFLQKNNDEKMQYLANNYLPLTGGTMTGTITTTANPALKTNGTNSYIVLCGAEDYSKGAHLLLNGKDRTENEGRFGIVANDGTNSLRFIGKPDGSLTWDNKDITVNSNIKDATMTADSTNVLQTGLYNHAYRCGCLVTVGINAEIKGGLTSGDILFSGLPKPKYYIGLCLGAGTASLRGYIDTNGSLRIDGSAPSTAAWISGCITYITTAY